MRRLLLIIGVLFLVSCTTTKYVPVHSVHTDSVYVYKQKVDSIYMRDSITIKSENDTIFITKWKTEYRYRMLMDTILNTRVDTIAVPYEVVKELSSWQKFKMKLGSVAIIACVLIILFLCVRKRIRK